MRGYQNEPVEELAKQLVAGLLRLRKGYIDSAEELLRIVKPSLEYPYEFVVYMLTGYRPRRRAPIEPLAGKTLRGDIQRMILDLCNSFELPVDAYDEKVYDTEALAKRMRVSTKTVQRWRRRGLVARRLVFPDGKKRIGFLESSVHAFAEQRRRQLLRSAHFTKLTAEEREEIIRRAKRMAARTGGRLHEISKRLAAKMGRAVETIRYTIRRHDRENPFDAVFPKHDHPLEIGRAHV